VYAGCPGACSERSRRVSPLKGKKYPWAEVSAQSGLASCARINQALLTSIGSLADHLADPRASSTFQSFLENQPVWMPTEGRFEPLLQSDILQIFAQAVINELVFVPEFPQSEQSRYFCNE
jgi:Protein of unknown function (DUF2711)